MLSLFFGRFLGVLRFGLLLLLLPTLPAAAQPARNAAARQLPLDQASRVVLRAPAAAQLRAFREQRDFQYVTVKSERSAWDLLWQRFWRWVAEGLDTPSGKVLWQYGLYAALVGALVFVVLKLLQVDITRAFGRGPRRAPLAYDAQVEDLHTLDFNTLVREAEAAGHYRLAVRLGYLEALKQLADQGLIRWQPDKTNHDYLYELPDGPLPAAFRELTRQFDYVWYGEHDDLTPAHYAQVRTTRAAFQQLLATPRRAA